MPDNRIYGIQQFGEGEDQFDRRMKRVLRQMLTADSVAERAIGLLRDARAYIVIGEVSRQFIRTAGTTGRDSQAADYNRSWAARVDALLAEHPELGKDNGNG